MLSSAWCMRGQRRYDGELAAGSSGRVEAIMHSVQLDKNIIQLILIPSWLSIATMFVACGRGVVNA